MNLIHDSLANLAAMFGLVLLIRNIAWLGELFRVAVSDGVHVSRSMMQEERSFSSWFVRAGTILLAIMGVALWHRSPESSLIAFAALAALLGWRWVYFARRNEIAYASMGLLALIAILAAIKSNGVL